MSMITDTQKNSPGVNAFLVVMAAASATVAVYLAIVGFGCVAGDINTDACLMQFHPLVATFIGSLAMLILSVTLAD